MNVTTKQKILTKAKSNIFDWGTDQLSYILCSIRKKHLWAHQFFL